MRDYLTLYLDINQSKGQCWAFDWSEEYAYHQSSIYLFSGHLMPMIFGEHLIGKRNMYKINA
jgi:hypothetical protein